MLRLISFSALNWPNCLLTPFTSILMANAPDCSVGRAALAALRRSVVSVGLQLAAQTRLAPLAKQQYHQGHDEQQDRDAEGSDDVVLVVENLDMQRQGVGVPADMPGNHRNCAEFAHRTGSA